jgi:hypothetical protein
MSMFAKGRHSQTFVWVDSRKRRLLPTHTWMTAADARLAHYPRYTRRLLAVK